MAVGMAFAVAPVGEGHIAIDADIMDRRRRPQQIEMEVMIAAAIIRMVAEIFRPVGRIGDFRIGQDRRHIAGEADERCDCRIDAATRPAGRQALELAADQERLDAARRGAEIGIVQDHPPVAIVEEG